MKKTVFSEIIESDKDQKEIYSYIKEFIKTNSDQYVWEPNKNETKYKITPKDLFFQGSIIDYCGEIDMQTLKSKRKISITMDFTFNLTFLIDLGILVFMSIYFPVLLYLFIPLMIFIFSKNLTARYYFFSGLKRHINHRLEGWK
jgi:hypothetical protein